MIIKFRGRRGPGHTEVRVFIGHNPDALGLAGRITMRNNEWEHLLRLNGGVRQLEDSRGENIFIIVDDSHIEASSDLPLDGGEFR